MEPEARLLGMDRPLSDRPAKPVDQRAAIALIEDDSVGKGDRRGWRWWRRFYGGGGSIAWDESAAL